MSTKNVSADNRVAGTNVTPIERPGIAVPVQRRVSVVLPAYNCEATIAAAVESCLNQSYRDVEVIVVNDGSTDRTAQVLSGFGTAIQVLHQSNAGLAAARNAGTRIASGEYVAWMDGDDVAMPMRFAIGARILAAQPAFVLVSSDFSAFTADQPDFTTSHAAAYYNAVNRLGGMTAIYRNRMGFDPTTEPGMPPVYYNDVYERLIWGNFIHPPTVMVRRSAFDEIGFFDETIRYSSDYDFLIRISRTGQCAYVDAPLLRYRLSDAQMSHRSAGGCIPLETVRILDKVRVADPSMYFRHSELFRRRCAESFLVAAESIGPRDRIRALRLLAHGLSLNDMSKVLRTLAKLVLPLAGIHVVRRVKANLKKLAGAQIT